METYKVLFLPEGIEVNVARGDSLLKAAALAGIELEGPCGGKGTCGKCKVKLVEKGDSRWVLACRTLVTKNIKVEIPQTDIQLHRKGELENIPLSVKLKTSVHKQQVTVQPPSLDYQVSDLGRLQQALEDKVIPSHHALKSLPRAIELGQGKVTVVLHEKTIIAVEPGDTTSKFYGIAVDIGTTTVVASLYHLKSGEKLGSASATNAQNIFGADVISRIEYVISQSDGLDQLQRRVTNVINRLLKQLCQKANIEPTSIYQAVVAGNTTMSHLFLGVDPRALAPSPYIPVFTQKIAIKAKEIGLNIAPEGIVSIIPCIAGYIGGDTTAMILDAQLKTERRTILAVDIGTNGEMVLAVNGRLTACSTAAGPAFEGAHIKFGMRAAPGAVEGVTTTPQSIDLKVIGGGAPKGICGSGLLELVQVLLDLGIITPSGRLISPEEGKALGLSPALWERLGRNADGNYFYLAPSPEEGGDPIVVYQRDIRELQLAKAAIRTGIEILLREEGLLASDLDQVLLAGAFGSFINKHSALGIGMLPPVNPDLITSIGNAAGRGASLALLSSEVLDEASEVVANVKHIELSGRADFQDIFVENLSFR